VADIIRNPDITEEMTKTLAGRAWFVFTVNLGDRTGVEGVEGNDYDIAGEGVNVLDEILGAYTKFPRGRFQLDYGGLVQDVREVGSENVQDLKAAFIAIYGNVNRPDVWGPVEAPWGPVS
jgi:hypothetical protein